MANLGHQSTYQKGLTVLCVLIKGPDITTLFIHVRDAKGSLKDQCRKVWDIHVKKMGTVSSINTLEIVVSIAGFRNV